MRSKDLILLKRVKKEVIFILSCLLFQNSSVGVVSVVGGNVRMQREMWQYPVLHIWATTDFGERVHAQESVAVPAMDSSMCTVGNDDTTMLFSELKRIRS